MRRVVDETGLTPSKTGLMVFTVSITTIETRFGLWCHGFVKGFRHLPLISPQVAGFDGFGLTRCRTMLYLVLIPLRTVT
jgi:hypothetical protein